MCLKFALLGHIHCLCYLNTEFSLYAYILVLSIKKLFFWKTGLSFLTQFQRRCYTIGAFASVAH